MISMSSLNPTNSLQMIEQLKILKKGRRSAFASSAGDRPQSDRSHSATSPCLVPDANLLLTDLDQGL